MIKYLLLIHISGYVNHLREKGYHKGGGGLRNNAYIHGIFHKFDECTWNISSMFNKIPIL